MKLPIAIVYHSRYGHTKRVAEELAKAMQHPAADVRLLTVQEAVTQPATLNEAALIVFGSPTYFGNVSAGFKEFMETTAGIWSSEGWKDKLAAGFTNSSSRNGDKLNTLAALSLFAAQHGMIWISQGLLPEYEDGRQTEGRNRMASYLGLMVVSEDDPKELRPMHEGDRLTIRLFGLRLLNAALALKLRETMHLNTNACEA